MIKKFISLAAVAASIFGCSGSDTVAADGDGHVASGVKKGTMTDPRDGQVYKTVKIGTQTWMAENLNYSIGNSYCYGENPANCQKYGRLYTWPTAMEVCPTGWHLPSKEEFETLLSSVGADGEVRSNNLRSSGWGNGADRYGFSALPAGFCYGYSEKCIELGTIAYFWSSTEYSIDVVVLGIYDFLAIVDGVGTTLGISVRCLQN